MSWLIGFGKATQALWSVISFERPPFSHLRRFVWLAVLSTLVLMIALAFAGRWLKYRESCIEAAPKHWGEMSYGHCFVDPLKGMLPSK